MFFLVKDNKETLPPKELVESQLIQEKEEDEKIWSRSVEWYKFKGAIDKVKNKIMDYLEFKI